MEPLPILLLGCIAGLSLSLRQLAAGRRGRGGVTGRTDRDPNDPEDLFDLGRGDVIQREDLPEAGDELVSAALRLSGAGPWRTLCLLEGGAAPGLLLVAERGAEAGRGDRAWLLRALPERRAELAVPTAAATESIEHDGLRHRLCGRFQALARAAGSRNDARGPGAQTAAAPSGEPLLLVCYRGPGSRRLLLTRWHGEPAAMLHVGEAVEPRQLLVLRTGARGPRSRRLSDR